VQKALQIVIVGIVAGTCGSASASLTKWHAEVQVSNGSGTNTHFAFDGGVNQASAYQDLSDPFGNAFAEASSSLSVSGYVPTLRARAVADPTRAQAVAWGVQGYRNAGAGTLSSTLQLRLSADLSGSNDIQASIYMFQEENFQFSKDPGTILFESSSQLWPGFEPFANNPSPSGFDVMIRNHSGPVNELREFDFTVDPGDGFYIWAYLVATADLPGEVDAFSTLTASFTNTEGLEPAAVVPEPATLALLMPAVIVILVRARRRLA
jgi:hypothetical protein